MKGGPFGYYFGEGCGAGVDAGLFGNVGGAEPPAFGGLAFVGYGRGGIIMPPPVEVAGGEAILPGVIDAGVIDPEFIDPDFIIDPEFIEPEFIIDEFIIVPDFIIPDFPWRACIAIADDLHTNDPALVLP